MRIAVQSVVSLLSPLIAALQFLTRLPIPIDVYGTAAPVEEGAKSADQHHTASDNEKSVSAEQVRQARIDKMFGRSVVYFPAAGLAIGGIVAALAWVLELLLPSYVNAVLLLAVWVMLSGGLHLDGLMDTADGLLSHRSRERMLEIMKDSRVGAMGVIVCALYLMLKTVLIVALLQGIQDRSAQLLNAIWLLAVIPIWSRAFMGTAMIGWRYARPGQGMGQLFHTVHRRHAIGAWMMAMGLTALILIWTSLSGAEVLVWCCGFLAVTFLSGVTLASLIARKLGGLTGDIYGALNELIELILLLGVVLAVTMMT